MYYHTRVKLGHQSKAETADKVILPDRENTQANEADRQAELSGLLLDDTETDDRSENLGRSIRTLALTVDSSDIIYSFNDDMEVKPMGYLIDRLLPRQGTTIISGFTGVGKTVFAFNQIGALNHNQELLGYQTTGKYTSLYIGLERGLDGIWYNIGLVWPEKEQRPSDSKFIYKPNWNKKRFGDLRGPLAWIAEKIEKFKFDAVFIDNLDEFKLHCHESTKWMYHSLADLAVHYSLAIVGLTAADKTTKSGAKGKSEDIGTATRKINLKMHRNNAAVVSVEGFGLPCQEEFIAVRSNGRWQKEELANKSGDAKLIAVQKLAEKLGVTPTCRQIIDAKICKSTDTASKLRKMCLQPNK